MRFPLKKSEIHLLANQMIAGFANNTGVYPNPPVSVQQLAARLNASITADQQSIAAHNIVVALRGGAPRVFDFKGLGKMGSLGHRSAVAEAFGFKLSGFIAWWMWRTIYLSKLPRFEKKFRVALDWTLDLVFSKDLVKFQTTRGATISQPHDEPVAELTRAAVNA